MTPVYAVSALMESGGRELLAEATAAGEWQVIPKAILFGILLGILYDGFRILRTALGLREKEYVSAWTARLCGIRRKRIPTHKKTARACGANESARTEPAVRKARMTGLWYRFPRLRLPSPGKWIRFFLDLLFSVMSGVLFSVFLYWQNTGILRWYAVLGALCGFFAYYQTIGRLVMHAAAFLLAVLRALLIVSYNHTVYYPLLWFSMLFGAVGDGLRRVISHAAKRRAEKARIVQKRKESSWQKKKSRRKKRSAFSPESHFSSSSDSAASPSSR